MIVRHFVLVFLVSSACLHAQVTTLSLSHDLIADGIADKNMAPGVPALDSRPLLEAAVTYAASHGITTLTADRGSYYFLTQHNGNAHVFINAGSNLVIDFRNSDLFFANSNVSAIQCTNCTSVTLQNFTLDYQQLPFTQVTVTSVNAANRSFGYRTVAGYQDPVAFNTNRAPDGSDAIFMFVFRAGVPIQQVGRLTASRPVSGGTIAITDLNDQWATPAAFASIQPGDTVVFSDRSGPPAINIVGGQAVTVERVSVYASGQIGVYFGRTNGAIADHVQVIPRPGTTRLISTNADGIHTSFALGANIFTNNTVRRTCDDALAISAPWTANVTKVSGATVTVARSFGSPFPPGVTVSFINPATDAVIGTATIAAETPAYSQQTLTDGETVTLTLDQAIVGLAANFGMADTDPNKLGSGSIVAYNTVQEGVFARGVWLAGVENVSVHDNFIQRTSSNGIFLQQLSAGNTDTGPDSNITVQNNLVDGAIGYANVSHGVTFAAASIYTVAQNSQNAEVTASPYSNIVVTGNRITNSARSAIRMENVTGGQMTGNIAQGFGLSPAVNVFTAPACCETLAQYEADFAVAFLAPASSSITDSGNQTLAAASSLANLSTASYSPRLATGSIAVAFGTNLTSTGPTVSITDSAGATQQAAVLYSSPSQINYLVPSGLASGIATVAIGSSSGAAQIDTEGPGLFTMTGAGSGVAAATASLYGSNGDVVASVPVFSCTSGGCVSVPMTLGSVGQSLLVTLYGTGFRNVSSLANAAMTIGGVPAQLLYVGAQPTEAGLDQINVVVPPSLAGAGEVPVVFTVDGQTSNVATLNFQ